MSAALPSLAGLSKLALAEKLVAIGVEPRQARMRAAQLWRWIYHYGVTDFAAMTNVAKAEQVQKRSRPPRLMVE